jgi:uncharacterized membrane protein
MDQFTSMVLIIGLPPAVIEFLALVWARGRLRLGLAIAMFLIPILIFVGLFATASGPGGDDLARLGLVTLAIVLLAGAVVGAALGVVVVLVRHMRRKGAASS